MTKQRSPDPASSLTVTATPGSLGTGSVWVHEGFDGDLFRVDADTLRVIDVLQLGVGSSSDVGSVMAVEARRACVDLG
jgi:hypothetical protein